MRDHGETYVRDAGSPSAPGISAPRDSEVALYRRAHVNGQLLRDVVANQQITQQALLLDPPEINDPMRRASDVHAALFNGRAAAYVMERQASAHSSLCAQQGAIGYVARDLATRAIAGSYVLTSSRARAQQVSQNGRVLSIARLSNLAVEQSHLGRHLGAALLWDALERVAAARRMSDALIAVAANETETSFYRYFGFELLE